MAIKLGWSSQPDEIFGLEGGLGNSPSEVGRVGFGVGFMVKYILYFFLIKRKDKRYKYEDKLGSKKIATVPRQRSWKCFLVFLNVYRS